MRVTAVGKGGDRWWVQERELYRWQQIGEFLTTSWPPALFAPLFGLLAVEGWEKFTVKVLADGKIALKGGRNGRWCADEGNTIKCNRNHVYGWEQFTVGYLGDNTISLKGGRNHKYCADEGHITKCNRNHVLAWEEFEVACHAGCNSCDEGWVYHSSDELCHLA